MTRDELYHPHWCSNHDYQGKVHRSEKFLVGPEPRHTGNGVAFVWLQQAEKPTAPLWMGVGAAHMAYATVLISAKDAALLWRGMGAALEAGGIDPVTGEPAEATG